MVGTMKGSIGTQTTSFNRPHCLLGYRTPVEVAYKYATVNGNGIKNSEVVDRGRLVL